MEKIYLNKQFQSKKFAKEIIMEIEKYVNGEGSREDIRFDTEKGLLTVMIRGKSLKFQGRFFRAEIEKGEKGPIDMIISRNDNVWNVKKVRRWKF